MKGVGIVGTKGYIEDVYSKTTAQAMRAVGNNTGNLVFQKAVYDQVAETKYVIGQDLSWDTKVIREHCRVIVIPSANHIRENFDMTGFVDMLEQVDLPLVFIGLGAQAVDYDKSQFDLHPSIIKLLDLVRERSSKVSVRGDFTAKVLASFGITHAEVTGCPSNFLNPDADLGDKIAAKMLHPLRSFITHGDEPWPKMKGKQAVEKVLTTWTANGAAVQSQQSVPSYMEFIRHNNPYSTEVPPDARPEALRKALMPAATLPQFLDYIATKLRVYFSVSQWMEDSAKFDFSVGLRLHGNMIAWQVGVPSLWLHHDSRTEELADVMAVPNMSYHDFLANCHSPEQAYAAITFDKVNYKARRAQLARRLADTYAAAGIKHNLAGLYSESLVT